MYPIKPYDRKKLIQQLYEAVVFWRDSVCAGLLPFDYAVKEYAQTRRNELTDALEVYVRAMELGNETEKEVNEEEGKRLTALRRETLLGLAKQLGIPEATDLVYALLRSLYYQQSIGKTLHAQTEALQAKLEALERGEPEKESIFTILGPISFLFIDPTVVEVIVDAPDKISAVYAGTGSQVTDTHLQFGRAADLRDTVDRLMALGGVQLTPSSPTGEIRLPDRTRILAAIPPAAVGSAYLYIEKVDPDKFTFSWDMLIRMGTLSPEEHSLLMNAITMGVSILVIGDTPNAKNYLLNLLIESIPAEQRVIIVADSTKLPAARHQRRIHLEPGNSPQTDPAALIEFASRMHPNWLVTGDLKGGETLTMIQTINAGRAGMTTLCAQSPLDALAQIEAMCLISIPNLGLAEIRQMVSSAFPLILFMKSYALPDHKIKITQLLEVSQVRDNRYMLQPLYTYDNETGRLSPTTAGETWIERQHSRITSG